LKLSPALDFKGWGTLTGAVHWRPTPPHGITPELKGTDTVVISLSLIRILFTASKELVSSTAMSGVWRRGTFRWFPRTSTGSQAGGRGLEIERRQNLEKTNAKTLEF
jgi:hypothetical protein